MREMLNPTSAIAGMGLGSSVALITDGRFQEHPEEHPSDMYPLRQQWAARSHWWKRRHHPYQYPGEQAGCTGI